MPGTLILTVDPAWPPVSGADIRNWQNAQAVSAYGPVKLLSVLGPVDRCLSPEFRITMDALSENDISRVYRRPPKGTAIDLSLPADAWRNLVTEIRRMEPDCVIFEHLALHPLLDTLAPGTARVIFDLHNIESDLTHQALRGWNSWFGSGRRQAAKVRAIEQTVCGRVDGIWTCSQIDARRISEICPSGPRPHVVPNGIPRVELVPRHLAPHDAARNGPRLLFLGHLGYPPNVIAAEVLATRILPLVKERSPATRLVIGGRNPHPRIYRLRSDSVEIVSNPPDMSPLLKAADVAVVPLTVGSGTRIKIIEAMAWGVPVVATRLAAEGLDLIDEVHVKFAATPGEFATAITGLYADAAGYAAQREAAHAHVFNRFGLAAIAEAVAAGFLPVKTSTSR